MSKNQNPRNLSNHVIDLLVDSTLKKHGVKLESAKIDHKEKEALNSMINNLKNRVEELNKDKNEKKDQ